MVDCFERLTDFRYPGQDSDLVGWSRPYGFWVTYVPQHCRVNLRRPYQTKKYRAVFTYGLSQYRGGHLSTRLELFSLPWLQPRCNFSQLFSQLRDLATFPSSFPSSVTFPRCSSGWAWRGSTEVKDEEEGPCWHFARIKFWRLRGTLLTWWPFFWPYQREAMPAPKIA